MFKQCPGIPPPTMQNIAFKFGTPSRRGKMKLETKIFTSLILLAILLTACGPVVPVATATPVTTAWFGMQVPPDVWEMQKLENTHYQHGILTHRTLTGCRAIIMSMDPVNAAGLAADWKNSFYEPMKTDKLQLTLSKIKDMDGKLIATYFDVVDITGQSGYAMYRLGYVSVETGEKAVECLDAVYGLLNTLQPELFPDIGTAQG